MRIKAICTYPDGPTLNGNIYSPQVLADAFNEPVFQEMNSMCAIPVKDSVVEGRVIGFACATLDGKRIEIDANIIDKVYEELLQDIYDTAGISLAGMCEKEPSGTLTAIKYREALLTSYSAVSCSMEIIKE